MYNMKFFIQPTTVKVIWKCQTWPFTHFGALLWYMYSTVCHMFALIFFLKLSSADLLYVGKGSRPYTIENLYLKLRFG